MDKKYPEGRKRTFKESFLEDQFWDCSVCTYKNIPGAFKCLMCDVRKGTSTRKARINPDLAAMQVQRAQTPPPQIIPRPLREDYRSSNDDDSRTRPGSSASNSSNEIPVTTNTDVALATPKEKSDPNATPKEKNYPIATPKENKYPNYTPKEKIYPNYTPKEKNDPVPTPKENNYPSAEHLQKSTVQV